MPIDAARERELVTGDAAATMALAERLGAVAHAGDQIALLGDLGAGKTAFAVGFARGLGIDEGVSSPSFILMAEHAGRLPLFHLDLYRLADASEALAAGLLDERQAAGVTLVEWAERLGSLLAPDRLEVRIEGSGDEPRRIRLRATGPGAARYLAAAGAEARG